MIRHIVFFKYKPDATAGQIEALAGQLRALPKAIDNIMALSVGADVGRKPNSYDLALDSLFDSMKDVEAYAIHPAHVEVLETVKEVCESTVKVDYELSD